MQASDRNVFSADDNNDEMRDDDTGDAKQTHVAVKVHVPQTYESGEQIFRRNQARKKRSEKQRRGEKQQRREEEELTGMQSKRKRGEKSGER